MKNYIIYPQSINKQKKKKTQNVWDKLVEIIFCFKEMF